MDATIELVKNTLSKSVYSILLRVVSLLYSVYVVRALTKDQYGLLAIVMTIVGLVNLLTNVGFPTMVTKSISRHYQSDLDKATSYFRFCLKVYTPITLFAAVILLVFAPVLARIYEQPDAVAFIRVGALLFVGLSIFGLYETAWVAINKYRAYLARVDMPKEIVTAIAGAILVYLGYGIWGVLSAQIGSVFIALVVSVLLLQKHLNGKPSAIDRRWIIQGALEITPGSWASGLSGNLDVLILGAFVPLSVLAGYNVSLKLITMLVALFPISAFTLPTFHTQSREEAIVLFNRIIWFTLLVFTPIIFFTMAFSREILFVLFGAKYATDYWVLSIAAFMILPRILSSVFVTALLYLGKFRIQSTIWVAMAVLNAGLMYFLTRSWGLPGALFTVLAINYGVLIAMGIVLHRGGMNIGLGKLFTLLLVSLPLLINIGSLWSSSVISRALIFMSSALVYLILLHVKDVLNITQISKWGILLLRSQLMARFQQ